MALWNVDSRDWDGLSPRAIRRTTIAQVADRGSADVALFEVGQIFKGDQPQDQLIAATGQTGNSFGCHLHFEVYVYGRTVNPQTFMADRGVWL